MLVTLYTKDLVSFCCNGDIEKFKSDREKNNVKRPSFLPGIRAQILSNFEAFFDVSLNDLTENYTCNGKRVDFRFVQKRVTNAVRSLYLGRQEKESHDVGEFERARRGMYINLVSI